MTRTAREPGCLLMVGLMALIGWAFVIPVVVEYAVVFTAWYADISKSSTPVQQILAYSFVHPVLLLVLVLGVLLEGPRYKAVAWTLLAATLIAAMLLIVRVVLPPMAIYSAALARLAIILVAALVLLGRAFSLSRADTASGADPANWLDTLVTRVPLALLCGALFILPWTRLGALGNWVDTLIGLAQGFALGLLAAGLLGGILLPGLRALSAGPGWDMLLGGLTLTAALVGIGGAFGQDDLQALMIPALGAAGFTAVAVALPGERGRISLLAPLIVVGLAASAPLVFADPEEVSLVVAASNDTFSFTFSAAAWMILIGLLQWWLIQPFANRIAHRSTRSPILAGVAVLVCAGVALSYATSSQTGLYGNDFFVIMKDQADLSGASQISDLTERRRFVYTTLVEQADTSQAGLRSMLDARGVAYTPFYLENAIEVEGDVLLREEIARRPEVERIIFSQALRPLPRMPEPEPGDGFPSGEPTWGVEAIGADRVWEEFGVRGRGIVIGQSDSGVQWDHPALRAAYRGSDGDSVSHDYNWFDPWTGRSEPWDGNGHGTHTIGTVLGADGIGVAPEATWFGCTNLVRNIGNPADYLHCMQFMLAPFPIGGDPLRDGDPARAADISTNSWGCPPIEGCDAAALLPAAQALRAAGIFFVAAAGNEGAACDSLRTPPGNYAALFSVGAIDEFGELADFSSRGPETDSPDGRSGPTLIAPGVDVLSAWPGDSYYSTSGTSMATPHVAGVVALIWSANPALRGDIDATEQILIETAAPYEGDYTGCGDPNAVPNAESGYGVVDAYAAVQMALNQ